MRVISRNHLFWVLCTLALPGASSLAEDRPEPPKPRPGEGRAKPEAEFAACADLKRDDVCEVALTDKTSIEGKCVPSRDEAKLQCLPENPPTSPN